MVEVHYNPTVPLLTRTKYDVNRENENGSALPSNYQALTVQGEKVQEESANYKKEEEVEISGVARWTFFFGWLFLASVSHLCLGGHTPMSQYLKIGDGPKPPPYSLTTFGNLFVLILYSGRLFSNFFSYCMLSEDNLGQPWRSKVANGWSRIRPLLSHWPFYVFIASIGVRSFTRSKALEYTNATFVQVIMLFAPFFIVLISALLFRERKIRWQMIVALVVLAIGSFVVLLGSSTSQRPGFFFLPHVHILFKDFGRDDFIGLALALVTTVALASKSVFISHLVDKYELKLSCSNLFIIERVARVCIFITPAMLLGDFHQFKYLTYKQWIVFFVTSFCNYGIGSFLDIYATAKLGSSIYGALLPLRLVSAAILDWILLGDRVNNLFQIIGFVIIFVAILAFMISTKWKDSEESFDKKPLLRRSEGKNMDPFSNIKLVY